MEFLNYMALVKHNNNSISAVTSMASLSTGSMVLIKEQTASSSASISFVDGSGGVVLDSTYPIYKFEFINIHPSAVVVFQFNGTTDGTNYNVTKTSTQFTSKHGEDGSSGALGYQTAGDLAQSTDFQRLSAGIDTANEASGSGNMFLFNPSSTTFAKHFIARMQVDNQAMSQEAYTAGYFNTTSAITGIQFKFSSGNIDSGTIKLYGIKDS
jgi:hypothetical protein